MVDSITVIRADLSNPQHRTDMILLINEYRTHTMGGGLAPMTGEESDAMLSGLSSMPTSVVLLGVKNGETIGVAVSFIGFSTFHGKRLLNIHDLIVKQAHRRQGVGKALLQSAESFARECGFCRLTLEVRADNVAAKHLYSAMGYSAGSFPMEFWTKSLNYCNYSGLTIQNPGV